MNRGVAFGAAVLALACAVAVWLARGDEQVAAAEQAKAEQAQNLPRLLDIGSKTCIPCKMMEPILAELKKEYAGKMLVEFVDVGVKENVAIAMKHKVQVIPTQIFFDASGKELWRHEGFIAKADILAKWAELGIAFQVAAPTFSRMEPAKVDARAKDTICYMCDGDIDARTRVQVQAEKGVVNLCSPHCFFIMYSCLTEDKAGFEKKVSVTDFATGKALPAATAVYLYGADEKSGRPTIKAFADRDAAAKERQASGGNLTSWAVLQEKELAHRCGFCDRACYPEDSALVIAGGVHTLGCCSHCALGVAARTGKDIEVHQPDRLTGQMIIVKTTNGSVSSLEPPTAVAWFGLKKAADGSFVSAGCFHQGFFVNEANLKKWVEQNPTEVGKQITIAQALADKMKLTPQQIQKACKIGECAPK